jgi:hypothetical protein
MDAFLLCFSQNKHQISKNGFLEFLFLLCDVEYDLIQNRRSCECRHFRQCLCNGKCERLLTKEDKRLSLQKKQIQFLPPSSSISQSFYFVSTQTQNSHVF